MTVKSLELKNFRNYRDLKMFFDKGTNILYGDNAQGKTNVLEALCVSGTTRSHKGSRDREMINFDEDEAHIRTVVEKEENEHQLDFHLKKNDKKGIAVDKIPVRRAGDIFGIMNIVFFSPEDLNIIKEGPSKRRKFLDMELSQIDRIYLADLTSYNKVLKQRNQLLKDIYFRPDLEETLPIWDEQLINYGERIANQRKEYIDQINSIVKDIHGKISGKKETLFLEYDPVCDISQMKSELIYCRQKDKKSGMTSIGPHRDDICFYVNDIDIRKYGSQGQQRTAALSLKLAEIEMMKKVTGETPVLLLDDVLSELDSKRQKYLLDSITGIQTVITCTGLDEFIKNRFQINRVFYVKEGHIEEKTAL